MALWPFPLGPQPSRSWVHHSVLPLYRRVNKVTLFRFTAALPRFAHARLAAETVGWFHSALRFSRFHAANTAIRFFGSLNRMPRSAASCSDCQKSINLIGSESLPCVRGDAERRRGGGVVAAKCFVFASLFKIFRTFPAQSLSRFATPFGPGRKHSLLPALAKNMPPACFLNVSRPLHKGALFSVKYSSLTR